MEKNDRGKAIKKLLCFIILVMCFNIVMSNSIGAQENANDSNDKHVMRVGWYHLEGFQEGMSDSETKSGYAYEYLQSIANYTGWDYEYVYGEWDELYEQFLNGEIDLMTKIPFSQKYISQMNFPAYSMGDFFYGIYVKDSNKQISEEDISTLNGRKLGVVANESNIFDIQKILTEQSLECEIVLFDDFKKRNDAIENGEVDAVIATEGTLPDDDGYKSIVEAGMIECYTVLSINCANEIDSLDKAIELIIENNPFYLNSLQIKYSEKKSDSFHISEEELAWIKENGRLRIGYISDYLPFCGKDDNGNTTGVVTDVFNEWRSKMNLEKNISLEYVEYDTYKEMVQALCDGEVDVAFPIVDCIGESEKLGIAQTNNVLESSVYIIYKNEYSSKVTDVIAVSDHSAFQRTYVKMYYPDSKLYVVNSAKECLDAVKDGKATCTLFNSGRAERYISQSKYKDLKVLTLGEGVDYCIGVNKGNTVVYSLMESGLGYIDKSSMINNMYKYSYIQSDYSVEDIMRNNMTLVLWVGVIIIGLVIIIAVILGVSLNKSRRRSEIEAQMLKMTNKQKEELEERDSIIENAGYGVWHIILEKDKQPRMKATPKMLDILGVPGTNMSEEEIYDFWYSRICKEEIQSVQESVGEMLDGKFSENTYLWNHPVKGNIYVRCGGFAQTLQSDKKILTGYHSDVTTIVKNEEENKRILELNKELAEAANNAKTSFLFNMSHDIRTPMNAIIGFAELIDRHQDEPEKRQEYIKKIKSSGEVLMSILNNVLEMSRIEKGAVIVEEEPWDAVKFNHSLQDMFSEQMEQKNIEFVCTYDITHQYVFCDPVKIRAIVMNILSNAYKYTNPGGKVTMHLEEIPSSREGYVFFRTTISDDGIGMSEEFLPHMFEEFERERKSEGNNIEGTGLGMQIVKRLVEMMDGKISVMSEKNVGTTFVIIIPHRIAEKEDIAETQEIECTQNDFEGKRILIAEDNDVNAEIAIELLTDEGFMVERAENGKICVDMINEKPDDYYDVIFMDVQMPEMNGYEATKAIRSNKSRIKANVPIIAVTANAFEEDKREAFACGMNGYIGKPVSVKILLDTLASILGGSTN